MFNDFFKKNETVEPLDIAISDLFEALRENDKTSEEYSNAADQLIKLIKLQREINPSWRPSPDAIVTAGASVLGILLILNFERLGNITSKALSFVGKMK